MRAAPLRRVVLAARWSVISKGLGDGLERVPLTSLPQASLSIHQTQPAPPPRGSGEFSSGRALQRARLVQERATAASGVCRPEEKAAPGSHY